MPKYDPSVIEKYAKKLYSQADQIMVTYAVLGAVIGVVGGWVASTVAAQSPKGGAVPGSAILVPGVVLCVLGFAIGRTRSFAIRLQAQMALCQLQIEINTRPNST